MCNCIILQKFFPRLTIITGGEIFLNKKKINIVYFVSGLQAVTAFEWGYWGKYGNYNNYNKIFTLHFAHFAFIIYDRHQRIFQ